MRGFLLDNLFGMLYLNYMLSGINIFTNDSIWRQILKELNANVLDAPNHTDLNLDDLELKGAISPMELKTLILGACDNYRTLSKIFGCQTQLPYIQGKIVIALYKTGGMTALELKRALGYAIDTSTHAVDTAIYQLRRKFGRDFVVNENGVYKLGRI